MSRKKNKKRRSLVEKRRNIVEFRLSKVLLICMVIALITTVSTVSVITLDAHKKLALANEEQDGNVTWVTSTHFDESGAEVEDLDEEGNPIKIPVPKGYSASKIPGETSLNTGFVIYEGDIDWDTVLSDTETYSTTTTKSVLKANVEPTNESNNEQMLEESDAIRVENDIEDEIEESKENENKNEILEDTIKSVNEFDKNTTIYENSIDEEVEDNGEKSEEKFNLGEDTVKNKEKETIEPITNIVEENEVINFVNINEIENNEESNTLNEIEEENESSKDNSIQALDFNEDENEISNEIEENEAEPLADEPTEEEITQSDINIFNLQKSSNQYVWVPVNDPSRIYGVDKNGKLWGKLYKFSSNGRNPLNWNETDGIFSLSNTNSNREPDVTHVNTNYDVDSSLQSYLDGNSEYGLLSKELEENFYLTIKSIKKYGGFYIGRYETGGLNNIPVVKKMDTNLSNQTWYSMYKKCKSLKGKNDNVITSMIWGSLWDETLEWLIESGAKNSNGDTLTYLTVASQSHSWGNVSNVTFYYIPQDSEVPIESVEKRGEVKVPAGSSNHNKVNNIFDLAGNVYDSTLELFSENDRGLRGGSYTYSAFGIYSAAYRYYYDAFPTLSASNFGCRTILLIK